jgi:hypothetical protein
MYNRKVGKTFTVTYNIKNEREKEAKDVTVSVRRCCSCMRVTRGCPRRGGALSILS